MAAVDLYGGDAERLRNQYRTSLGRDASDDEISGWLSGQFGGGGLEDKLHQITTSGEAQQRQQPITVGQNPDVSRPMDTGPTPEFTTQLGGAYQQHLGRDASPDEITNWWSGGYGHGQGASGLNSFLSAIQNSGEARQRQATPPPTGGALSGPGPQGGNFQQWFQQLTQGKAPTPQSLRDLAPMLQQHGIRLGPTNARGFTDGIILPDGTFIDVILGATENGGTGWGWIQPTGGVGGGPLPGNQYSDPYTQVLEMLLKSRIGNLQGGFDDSMRQQYQQGLQQRANALGRGNQQLDQLMGYLQTRFNDLQGPGYTGAENEVIRTAALDPVERDRAAARQRAIERLSARGLNLESGVSQAILQEVDQAFDSLRAQNQTALATNEMTRREDRNQRAEMIGAQLADIPDQRAREQLDVFSALENLSLLARNEDASRSREAISYGGALSDLGPQRLQMAMQAAGMGGNPASLGSLLGSIAGMNQQASLYGQQQSNALWSGLGTLAAIIARSGRSGLSNYGI